MKKTTTYSNEVLIRFLLLMILFYSISFSSKANIYPNNEPGIHRINKEIKVNNCFPNLSINDIEELCKSINLGFIPFNVIDNDTLCENSFGEFNSLYFIGSNKLTIKIAKRPTKEDALIKMAEIIHINQYRGLQLEEGIADEAISLTYRDELMQLRKNHLIFRKNNMIIELETILHNWSKTECPCYNPLKLKNLAQKIAEFPLNAKDKVPF